MKLTDEKILEVGVEATPFGHRDSDEFAIAFARAILKEAGVEELEREPVAFVHKELMEDGRSGPVVWLQSPSSMPNGTKFYTALPSAECKALEELEEKAALYDAIQEAAGSLVGGYSIELKVERHAGWVKLFDEDGYSEDFPSNNESLADSIRDALGEAIRRTNEEK